MTDDPGGWQVLATVGVVAASIGLSLLGLLRPDVYTDAAWLVARTRVEDLVILAVGAPSLVVGLWSARRGSTRGRIVWLGALAFATYVWASRATTVEYTPAYLGYVAALSLSAFALAGGTFDLDAEAVASSLRGRVSRRLYAGVLGAIAAGLSVLWLSDLVPALVTGTSPALVEEFGARGLRTVALDLGFVVPTQAVAAAWLWRDRDWGYALVGVQLVFGALVAPLLTAMAILDFQTGVAVTPGLVLGTVVPPLVAAGFAATYVRAIGVEETR